MKYDYMIRDNCVHVVSVVPMFFRKFRIHFKMTFLVIRSSAQICAYIYAYV